MSNHIICTQNTNIVDGNADTPANKGFDAFTSDRCHAHGHGLRGGEPVGVVVT